MIGTTLQIAGEMLCGARAGRGVIHRAGLRARLREQLGDACARALVRHQQVRRLGEHRDRCEVAQRVERQEVELAIRNNDQSGPGEVSNDGRQEQREKIAGETALRLLGPHSGKVLINQVFYAAPTGWEHHDGSSSAGDLQTIRLCLAKHIFKQHLVRTKRGLESAERRRLLTITGRS